MSPQEKKNLLEKKIKRTYGKLIAEKTISTPQGEKYILIYKNGCLNVISNLLPKAEYDECFRPETIIGMFEKRAELKYGSNFKNI